MTDNPSPTVNGITKYRQEQADENIREMRKNIEELQRIVHEQDVTIATLKERLSIFSMAQATLTIIVGAVAAFIGRSG